MYRINKNGSSTEGPFLLPKNKVKEPITGLSHMKQGGL